MFRKLVRKENHHTEPDHRPMIPELRKPGDLMDAAVRQIRRRYDEINPSEYMMKWR